MVRAARHRLDEDDDVGPRRGITGAILDWARRRPTDTAATLLAIGATLTIAINALFLQSGPHPAPIFANKPLPAPAASATVAPVMPKARSSDLTAVVAKPRSDAVVAEIQRELARKGFYDGTPDGIYGPRTD